MTSNRAPNVITYSRITSLSSNVGPLYPRDRTTYGMVHTYVEYLVKFWGH